MVNHRRTCHVQHSTRLQPTFSRQKNCKHEKLLVASVARSLRPLLAPVENGETTSQTHWPSFQQETEVTRVSTKICLRARKLKSQRRRPLICRRRCLGRLPSLPQQGQSTTYHSPALSQDIYTDLILKQRE